MGIVTHVGSLREQMIDTLCELARRPAISPAFGGNGELDKVEYLHELIEGFGFDELRRYDSGDRPNLAAMIKGTGDRTLWIVTHTDVVAPGPLEAWQSNPFEPVVKDGKVYGRGCEDNGQSLVASLYACKALLDSGLRPKRNIGLLFVADEETGSEHGIKHLIGQGIFDENDVFLVPDAGNEKGTLIEVAEKSILWVKVKSHGVQSHASLPQVNAFKSAMLYYSRLHDSLKQNYGAQDKLFDVPVSTFEPTKKEKNVGSVNIIPGEDVFYMDCRILPQYDVDDVLATMRAIADDVAKDRNAKIELDVANREEASRTDPNIPLVGELKAAVETVYKAKPCAGGIGGGTCAGIFRKKGYDAIVWSRIDSSCHKPNEYCRIDNLVNDAKVYAQLITGP